MKKLIRLSARPLVSTDSDDKHWLTVPQYEALLVLLVTDRLEPWKGHKARCRVSKANGWVFPWNLKVGARAVRALEKLGLAATEYSVVPGSAGEYAEISLNGDGAYDHTPEVKAEVEAILVALREVRRKSEEEYAMREALAKSRRG